ncbi:hypothetical protein HerbRD11066_47670 [Herbidospora sp. RD11066]
MPPPSDRADPRAWCGVAAARLRRDQPEEALEAARQAVDRDPHGEWGHRLASLSLERLGRDSEAVASAQEAVRLAPGSWAARLRLAGALRRLPARWREARDEVRLAVRYAPEQPGPHALAGDLALVRGDHESAAASYRAALRRDPAQPGARVNLGLTFLRWDRHRDHHDPAWDADPRDTGRARRALETWSRRIRLLLALALVAVSVAGLGFDLHDEAKIAGYAVLAAVAVITYRHVAKITVWPLVPAMLGRDLWLSVSVTVAVMTVAAYAIGVAGMPALEITLTASFLAPATGGEWAGALGFVLFNGPAVAALRLLLEAWRGHPIRALAQFARVPGDAVAWRDTDVTLWVIAGRAWWVTLAIGLIPWPFLGITALAVPVGLALAGRRTRPWPVLRRDRWLGLAFALLVVAAVCFAVAGADPDLTRAWQGGWAALAGVAAAFTIRGATAWWRGAPGPTRASLLPRGHPPADLGPSSGLTNEVRHAATFSRSVVLSYAGPSGPRSVAVSAVTSVSPSGEMRVIAGDEAWEAVERDPRVSVFVGDPRFWAEVRGVAIADNDVLRITPREVLVREYPGRHQARTR